MRIFVAGSKAKTPSDRRSPLDDQVLQFEDLQILSRKKRIVDVARWADAQGIPYRFDGKGGLWTTLAGLNAALGLGSPSESSSSDGIATYSPPEMLV
jgi:hypothetical protein